MVQRRSNIIIIKPNHQVKLLVPALALERNEGFLLSLCRLLSIQMEFFIQEKGRQGDSCFSQVQRASSPLAYILTSNSTSLCNIGICQTVNMDPAPATVFCLFSHVYFCTAPTNDISPNTSSFLLFSFHHSPAIPLGTMRDSWGLVRVSMCYMSTLYFSKEKNPDLTSPIVLLSYFTTLLHKTQNITRSTMKPSFILSRYESTSFLLTAQYLGTATIN